MLKETFVTTRYHHLKTPLPLICIAVAFLIALTATSFNPSQLGLNAAIVIGVFLIGATIVAIQDGASSSQIKIWFSPLFLVASSYALYENFFLEWCNYIALPLGLGIAFVAISGVHLRLFHLVSIVERALFAPFSQIHPATEEIVQQVAMVMPKSFLPGRTTKSVLKGVGLGSLLIFGLVLPLLMNSDEDFSKMILDLLVPICDFLNNFFSLQSLVRAITFCVSALAVVCFYLNFQNSNYQPDISDLRSSGLGLPCLIAGVAGISFGLVVGIFAGGTAWLLRLCIGAAEAKLATRSDSESTPDSLAYGIVFTMVGIIYLLFIGLQAKQLLATPAEVNFKIYEVLAKRGFWQLLVLTALNIGIVIHTFNRLVGFGSMSLRVFTLLSTLLLASAGHRLGSYVILFGLSYEKWYACYTVLFCALVFIILFSFQWRPSILELRSAHPMKAILLLLIWMYGLGSIFPVGTSIVLLNRHFATWNASGIDQGELRYLSVDAVPAVVYTLPRECVKSGDCRILNGPNSPRGHWNSSYWLHRQSCKLSERRWYQHSATSVIGSWILKDRGIGLH
jgi:hypothetical protein